MRSESGLPAAPIKLSVGYQDAEGRGYGLSHIEANHGSQIRKEGFASVQDFVSYVAQNYDEDNIRVGKRRSNGSITYLLQVSDSHDNTLFIEMSRDGSYWNVNSAGIFRKGYSNKKETVVKTEPQQSNNAVSTGSSLSADSESGIMPTEPNGKPTASAAKVGKNPESGVNKQEKSEKTAEKELPSEENESATDAKGQQTVQRRNEPQDIEAQLKHLEEIKDYPGADKKAVQAEIDRLKGLQTDEDTGMSALFEKVTRALEPVTEEEARLRDAVNGLMRKAGIPVIDDVEEGQRVLDMVNEARLSKDKKSTRNRLAGDKLQVINCHFKCRWCKGIKRFG